MMAFKRMLETIEVMTFSVKFMKIFCYFIIYIEFGMVKGQERIGNLPSGDGPVYTQIYILLGLSTSSQVLLYHRLFRLLTVDC